jgi:ubiquitin carboxyl-terminal hydrolase 5/13
VKQTIDAKEIVRPRIPLSACIESFSASETVEDFYSTAINAKSIAEKCSRMSTFPDYLLIQLKKFTIGEDWTPKKLDVSIDVPDELDLSCLRGTGKQAGEEELPEAAQAQQAPAFVLDDGIVGQLVEMGFSLEGCKRAVFQTKNAGIEPAMNWVMEHMGDPDFNDPFEVPGNKASSGAAFTPNDDALAMIMSMGFNKDQATKALKATDNNVERAADWIFSHAGELEEAMDTAEPAPSNQDAPAAAYRDGVPKYKLAAFISHMGTSTMVGHYVCHIRKDGRWIIFNDEKVALSEKPPKDLAYMYLYQRAS